MIKVTLAVPQDADPEAGATTKHYPDHDTMVCVEHAPGLFSEKKISDVTAGEKLCLFGRPRPSPGVTVTSTEEV